MGSRVLEAESAVRVLMCNAFHGLDIVSWFQRLEHEIMLCLQNAGVLV